jgi:predicted proteasome-type protease
MTDQAIRSFALVNLSRTRATIRIDRRRSAHLGGSDLDREQLTNHRTLYETVRYGASKGEKWKIDRLAFEADGFDLNVQLIVSDQLEDFASEVPLIYP